MKAPKRIGSLLPWLVLCANLFFLLMIITGVDLFMSVKILYYLDLMVLPALLIVHAGYLLRQRNNKAWRGIAAALFLIFVQVYVTYIEPTNLQIKEVYLHHEDFDREFVLVHLTDIQSDGIGDYERAVFEQIQSLEPHLVIHTGDLIQLYDVEEREAELRKLATLFKELNPLYGTYHVNGDCDWPDQLRRMRFDQLAGVHTMDQKDTVLAAKEGFPSIQLFGLNLKQSRYYDEVVDQRNWNPEHFNIMLGHAPDYVVYQEVHRMNLCLAGHTHGGQVRVPGLGPIMTLSNVPKEWARGFRKVNYTYLNVSAGIGAEHASGLPSIRLFCPPEITVIRIGPKR